MIIFNISCFILSSFSQRDFVKAHQNKGILIKNHLANRIKYNLYKEDVDISAFRNTYVTYIWILLNQITLHQDGFKAWRGYSNYFLTWCAARGLKHFPKSKNFSPSKIPADLTVLFKIFANRNSFLKVFIHQKWLVLQVFCNFCEMGPSDEDFFDQNGTQV